MNERDFWLGFSAFPGVGPKKFNLLLKNFGTAKEVWTASVSDISDVLGKPLAEKFEIFRNQFSIEDYENELKEKDVKFLILTDKEYPLLLSQIKNPPFVLYIKGNIEGFGHLAHAARDARQSHGQKQLQPRLLSESRHPTDINLQVNPESTFSSLAGDQAPIIAVVGTRKTTHYGREVTEFLTGELVLNGFTIVSGLATGIDTVAHQTALSNKGKTIAVLGSGVDFCTPPTNLKLYNEIIANGGCIVSELPLGHPPTKGSFPARNRIIAGLSQGVLVTEGAEDSGALITADYAFKNNRKVFAVPGPITSFLSKGPYKLIQKGAKLVTKVEDILQELKFEYQNSKSETNSKSQVAKMKTENKEERKILEILENEPLHFDEIVKLSQVNPSKLGAILSMMEIRGLIKSQEGGFFSMG